MSINVLGTSEEAINQSRTEIEEYIHSARTEPAPKEVIKTPEEVEFIETFLRVIKQEFKELGIEREPNLTVNDFHIFDKIEDYPEGTISPGRRPTEAFILSIGHQIFITRTWWIDIKDSIVHEGIHGESYNKVYADIKDGELKTSEYRSGMGVNNPISRTRHFAAFEEAINTKWHLELLKKYQKEFKITDEEYENILNSYRNTYGIYIDILDTIISKVCEDADPNVHKSNIKSYWNLMKRNKITGETTHINAIQRKFGGKGIQILKSYGRQMNNFRNFTNKNLPAHKSIMKMAERNFSHSFAARRALFYEWIYTDKIINEKVKRYFETDDQAERDIIANEILLSDSAKKYNTQLRRNSGKN